MLMNLITRMQSTHEQRNSGISEQLHDADQGGDCVVVDCRFDLSTAQGREDWLAGHIPGAFMRTWMMTCAAPMTPTRAVTRYRETDVCSIPGFAGWAGDKLLVAYDDGSNAISSRLWWMMKYYGKPAALLDGGLGAWLKAGFPWKSGSPVVDRGRSPGCLIREHDRVCGLHP